MSNKILNCDDEEGELQVYVSDDLQLSSLKTCYPPPSSAPQLTLTLILGGDEDTDEDEYEVVMAK